MSTIKIKRSGTGGQAPAAGDLAYGELALNYADGKLYYKDATDAVAEIGAGGAGGLDANTDTIAIGSGAAANANAVAVGVNADATDNNSIAIGNGADANASHAIAIGLNANPYTDGIVIGRNANGGGSGSSAIVIGREAGGDNIGIRSVAIGYQSGGFVHGSYSPKHETTHVGGYAGRDNPQAYSTGIGVQAGASSQGSEAVAVGRYAGNSSQGANAIAVGSWAAQTSQPANSIAISAVGNTPTGTASPNGQYGVRIQTSDSGSLTYSTDSDWVFGAPVTSSEFKFSDGTSMTTAPTGGSGGLDSAAVIATMNEEFKVSSNQVEIGSGASTTNGAAVAIGRDALSRWSYSIAIGQEAEASFNSKTADIALGFRAQATGSESIAIGRDALANQISSLAIGNDAEAQGVASIAIGKDAKNALFADYSIVMGENTTINNSNSIALNASGSPLAVSGSNSIDIRTSAAGSLTYDTTDDWTFGAEVSAPALTVDAATSDWKFSVSGDDLIISFGGTSKAKLDTDGNLTVVGDVTAFGTI